MDRHIRPNINGRMGTPERPKTRRVNGEAKKSPSPDPLMCFSQLQLNVKTLSAANKKNV